MTSKSARLGRASEEAPTDENPTSFQLEARAWIAKNFPAELAGTPPPDKPPYTPAQDHWRNAMGETGWGVPTWPKEYGGAGLARPEADALAQELRRAGAYNPIDGLGVALFGPTLLEFGTVAQKLRFLPEIARNKVRWCQGFSEPGAGSDLASLQTKADDNGDHFVVNGQKIWTSGACDADMCFCLVRTDNTQKHKGISFLAIDMNQPGVEARRLRLINDTEPFCEVFFTDAIAPKENLIGELNDGWTVTKRLLQFERQGGSGLNRASGPIPGELQGPSVQDLAKTYVGLNLDGHIADADLRRRLIDHLIDEEALQLTGRRAASESRVSGPSATSSILKNIGSKIRQDKAEMAIEIMGFQGLGWKGEQFEENELNALKTMLRSKSATIAGGTWEVQLNIVAKRILGLPTSPGA